MWQREYPHTRTAWPAQALPGTKGRGTEIASLTAMKEALRIVVVAPELAVAEPRDQHALRLAERSRMLRIGLLENNLNLVAVLPADAFLSERLAQLQPDLVIVDAESEARDAHEHVMMATRPARSCCSPTTKTPPTFAAPWPQACAPTSWPVSRPSASAPSWTSH